jgi:phosphoribosylformylglycinamidine synthase
LKERTVRRDAPFPLFEIVLDGASDDELTGLSEAAGLALSVEELRRIRDHFAARGRPPTDVELQSLGQSWSEHCCYKSSKPILRRFIFPVQTPAVLDRGDAGVVEFDEEHAYALRIESHNHPSAVEPYGGATTGIGGILRDVLAMGAQPIALVDPLHFGPLDYAHEKLPKGMKHPLYLFGGVVAGIRDYGNRVGIPTVAGSIFFDEGYVGNIIVNVGCVGFAKKRDLQRNRVREAGDVFVLAGGKTGRDGIHGVTYASIDLTEEAVEEWQTGAVQLGDPIMKEPLIHACLDAARAGLLHGLKDLGGGGLSCVVGEMAFAAGLGADIDLDKVPLKEPNMAPWEIWVSESQERMMLAVPPAHVDEVLRIFSLYDVPAVPVGYATTEPVLRVRYRGVVVYEMETDFLVKGPEYERAYAEVAVPRDAPDVLPPEPEDCGPVLLDLLGAPNIASKEFVIRQYDHEVRASTVIKPMQGVVGKACHGDAAVVRPLLGSYRALAITTASTPQYTAIDPFRGGATAVEEACRNLAAVNARPHALTNCLSFGNPERPDRLGSFREAVRGIGHVAARLGLAVPSGNVSFYNESVVGAVPPTPVVLAVGIVEDFRRCVTTDAKEEGNVLYVVGETRQELGGSEYLRLRGGKSVVVPDVDLDRFPRAMTALGKAMDAGLVAACHDVSHGGVAVAAAEMCLGGDVGMHLDLKETAPLRFDVALFSESNGRWLVEVREDREDAFRATMADVRTDRLGAVGGDRLILRRGRKVCAVDVDAMRAAWTATLPRLTGGVT